MPEPSTTNVSLETQCDSTATIWFDVPGRPVNTFSASVFDDLEKTLDMVDALEVMPAQLRFASAKDGTFIAGADLKAIRDLPDADLDALLKRGQSLFSRIESLPMQTIAMIHGAALGGGLEIALACDYRIAVADPDHRKTIGLPEITLGIIPGWGGTLRLPRLIGVGAATHMLFTGRTVAPQEAKTLGIIDQVVAAGQLQKNAEDFIATPPTRPAKKLHAWQDEIDSTIASLGPIPADREYAAATLLNALRSQLELAPTDPHAATQLGFDLERQGLIDCRNSEQGRSLIAAFFDKRRKV